MNLQANDFELFDLPPRQAQDRAEIDAHWRSLQAKVHPDRFASEGPAAQRIAMQWAVRVNEAYQRLKDPLRRAAYLCELNGASVDAENNTAMPAAFLMQQMAWREALDEARDARDAAHLHAVEALADDVASQRKTLLAELSRTLDEQRDFAAAAQQVRALMFVERFEGDVDRRLEALGQ
jgi:molecular chaperone HscB